MSKIKAVLFDMDGTLNDTRHAVYEALEQAFAVHDVPAPSREEMAPYIHSHNAVHDAFASHIEQKKFLDTYFEKVFELLPTSHHYTGVKSILEQLYADGYKLGLVTGAVYLKNYFEQADAFKHFAVVVGPEETAKSKPDPQGTNLALKQLKLEPTEAVMVGDLATDIKTAKAAGLAAAIGITHGFGTRESLEEADADYIIDQLSELPDILKKLG
ncbi:MAG: HAD family hydrolase [Candidatus Saccharimonadales bacterium]